MTPKTANLERSRRSETAFTLVELLIVVIILAVLASVVIPLFSASSDDAKQVALETNLQILRDAIDRYTAEHGHFPGAVRSSGTCAVGTNLDTATPGAAAFVAHLTQYTTRSGVACSQSNGRLGGQIKFGPYLRDTGIPTNPFTGDDTVQAIQTGSLSMTANGTDLDGGWLYDFIVGKIIANQPSFDEY